MCQNSCIAGCGTVSIGIDIGSGIDIGIGISISIGPALVVCTGQLGIVTVIIIDGSNNRELIIEKVRKASAEIFELATEYRAENG